ncbi:FAD-binding oxidoreductase [Arthrobacter sp. Sr24]
MESPQTPAPATVHNFAFGALRRNLTGALYEPGSPTYTELATPWNLATATSPAAVVEAASAEDVAECVKFAAANGLPVAVQATGHGIASNLDGALLIHTRSLDACTINTERKLAQVGAGVTWATVLSQGADQGMIGLCGSAPGVSVAGYTSGGGIGPMARSYGAASDKVRSFDGVTGDGQIRHVTAQSEPDLFWGLRGGKGSLGIITSMEFELLELPLIYAGALFFDTVDVENVLRIWAQWCPTLPLAATTSVAMMQLPPMPGVPEPLAGKFTIAVRYVFTGTADDGATWLAPMRSAGAILMDAVGPMPSSMIGLVHSDPEDPLPATERSTLLTDFPVEAAETLLAAAGPESSSPQLMVEIRQFGGALAQAPTVASALCHREAAFGLHSVAVGAPPELPALGAHAEAMIQNMSPWAYGGTLPNFAAGNGAGAFAECYTPTVLEKLTTVARYFDPENVFRLGQVPER